MELMIPKNKLICIDYPAIVANHDKMLESLGGERTISKVTSVVE